MTLRAWTGLTCQLVNLPPSTPSDQITSSLSATTAQSLSTSTRRCNILNERKRPRECQTDQAERMVKRSSIELNCKLTT